MKISEFIKELQSLIDREGDLDVRWPNYHYSDDLNYLGSIASLETTYGVMYLNINTH